MSLNELSENGFQGKMRTDVIEKVHYDGPISIANLFSDSNVKYTLNHIFASFIDKTNEARRDGIEFEEPVVYNEKHSEINVDYGFLIDCLAELVDDKFALMRDFVINFKDTKNAEFLTIGILEDMLRIVELNSKTINCRGLSTVNYRPSFIRLMIIRYRHYVDDSERFIQMSAVSFKLGSVKNLLNSDIFKQLMYTFESSSFKKIPTIFGRKACAEFWKSIRNEPKYFTLVHKI